jgi:hypothetical protein
MKLDACIELSDFSAGITSAISAIICILTLEAVV